MRFNLQTNRPMRLLILTLTVTLNCSFLSAQDTLRILPLGNSITQAENIGSNNYNSYRRELYFDLGTMITAPDTFDFIGSQNTAYDNVPFPDSDFDPDHEGHWGFNADEIASNLGSWLTNLDTPDMVLMHLGTNDCADGESIVSTIAELELIIDELRTFNPQVTTFIAQVIPSPSLDVCLNELNDSIPDLAMRKDLPNSKVIVVDQNTGFNAATDTYDNLHPNLLGEDKIAARWFSAIETFINNSLPVDLIYFAAKRVANEIEIKWTTANEIGIDGFEIEKSHDLVNFQKIGFQIANYARSGGPYQFHDPEPVRGAAYYRLKILEADGHTEYSNIITVGQFKSEPFIRPNILASGENIYVSSTNADSEVLLLNLAGQRIGVLQIEANKAVLPALNPGMYLIAAIDKSWVEKIIIH